MPPHETKKTLSLNKARNLIVAMSKPMGEAVELIQMNLKRLGITNYARMMTIESESSRRFSISKAMNGW